MAGKLGIGRKPVNRYGGYMPQAQHLSGERPLEQRLLKISLLGGHPALDFVNTLDWRTRDDRAGGAEECLISYAGLLAWAQRLKLIGAAEARELAVLASAKPKLADAVVGDAIALREAIYQLLSAAMAGRRPRPAELDRINHWLDASNAVRLIARPGGYALSGQEGGGLNLAQPLRRLALQAAELLASDKLPQVRCCAGPGCGWLFLDTSPNKQRRWCSMESCGNRTKAKRHYKKARQKI